MAFFRRFATAVRRNYGVPWGGGAGAQSGPPHEPRVLFISRKDVGTRDLDIEAETAAWLRRRGIKVEVIEMGRLPFEQQVAAVARSNVLVAANGAGMVHSLFLPPEAVVIEVTWRRGDAHGSWPPHYRNLARYLGRHYMLVEAEGKPLARS